MVDATLPHENSRIEPRFGPDSGDLPATGGSAAPGPARRVPRWLLPVVLMGIAVAALGILWLRGPAPTSSQPPVPQAAAVPQAPAPEAGDPAIRHPIAVAPVAPDAPPLPVLDTSDVPLSVALAGLWSPSMIERYLVPQDVVRHIVATIDNLPRRTYAQRLSPVRPAPGIYAPAKAGDALVVAAAQTRYAPFVGAVESVNAKQVVAVYTRYYPLLQQAYQDLGYPKGYFNDRLVEALDVMLATPETTGPIVLVQPKVLYEFADPALEALPSGQKLLLRIGPDNARRVKAKLREIRALVAVEKR